MWRYRAFILLTWNVPPVVGLGFLLFIRMFTPAQMLRILSTPVEPLFIVGSSLFAYFYFDRYIQPVARRLAEPTAKNVGPALECMRRFPLHYWSIFIAYLVLAPSSVMVGAILHAGFEPTTVDWFRIHLVALIVSIIVGLPIFFLILDLFGRALDGTQLQRAHLTIRTKVFLIGALVPLLIDTMLVQYYWTRTGYFTLETFFMWLLLEALAVAGSLIFVRSFGQSLQPLQQVIEQGPTPGATVVGQARSTDELGVLTNDFGALMRAHNVAREALYREKELAQVTLASIGDGVITTDTAGHVTFLNPVAELLTGWRDEDARGRPLEEVFRIRNEITGHKAVNPVARCLREGRIVGLANHTVLERTDGREFAIEDSAAPINDSGGHIVGVVLVFHDTTRAREMANRLAWQATHDPLSGLFNRAAFERRLRELLDGERDGATHLLLYIDLDQFKVVNDIAGHVAGDEMLRQIAGIMQQQVHDAEMLARLGGDEFGLILRRSSLEKALEVASDIHESLATLRFRWGERQFRVGASIGLLAFEPGQQSITDLLSHADLACYAAKHAGRSRTHVYVPEDAHTQRHRREMDWATRISEALEQDQLVLYGQSIVALDGKLAHDGIHVEILVRMNGHDGEIILPDIFLPAAERFDLMPIVDRWVITRAFSQVAAHTARGNGRRIEQCSINLSGATLGDDGLLPFIKAQLALHEVPASLICFEITETAAISNLVAAMRMVSELRALGCRFALDDFGSGMSSFSYLRTLPVDYLKIDGAFVSGMSRDPVDRALVSNINDIGHLLGKRTIAEYAENDEIVAELRSLGVDYAQGFGLDLPAPLDEVFGRA